MNDFVVFTVEVLNFTKTYPQKAISPITIYIIVLLLLLAPYLPVNNCKKPLKSLFYPVVIVVDNLLLDSV